MSLNADWRTISEQADKGKVDLFVYYCMFTGIPEINEDTYEEFWTRANFISRLSDVDLGFTRKDVVDFIGFKTNATPITKRQLISNQYKGFDRQLNFDAHPKVSGSVRIMEPIKATINKEVSK